MTLYMAERVKIEAIKIIGVKRQRRGFNSKRPSARPWGQ
jgi:hypothetical protein